MNRAPDMTGVRFGRLVARELLPGRSANRNLLWLCECDCGKSVVVKATDLRTRRKSCGCARVDFMRHLNAQTSVSYHVAHARVRRARGSACDQACVDCGESAQDWTYNGLDPAELYDITQKWHCAYSLSPDYYVPRCRKCHYHHDRTKAPHG